MRRSGRERGRPGELALALACVFSGAALIAVAEVGDLPTIRWLALGLVVAGGVAFFAASRS